MNLPPHWSYITDRFHDHTSYSSKSKERERILLFYFLHISFVIILYQFPIDCQRLHVLVSPHSPSIECLWLGYVSLVSFLHFHLALETIQCWFYACGHRSSTMLCGFATLISLILHDSCGYFILWSCLCFVIMMVGTYCNN